jgi:TatD DNase family protein
MQCWHRVLYSLSRSKIIVAIFSGFDYMSRIFTNLSVNLNMNLVDTHAHLFLDEFKDDLDEVVQRARDAGVSKAFLPNVDRFTFQRMIEISERFDNFCYPMIGLHPSSVKEDYLSELQYLISFTDKYKFYAVGETGIDLYWDKTFLKEQQDAFMRHIELARKLRLPVVIHSRNSYDEIFEIMDDHHGNGLKGIFHSFTGTVEQAGKIISYGFMIGIGGIVTFKNSGLDRVVAEIPLESIVLETDSPYLAPAPRRGKRNEPSYLVYTTGKMAEIYQLPVSEVARITTENALNLYSMRE